MSAPPKLRRRPLIYAVGAVLICAGALINAWVFNSNSDTHTVLAVRSTVERGQTIERSDLTTVKIGIDPALHPLSASDSDQVIGKHAALDIPSGGVLTAAQVADTTVPDKGRSVVGVSLSASMLPAHELKVGDNVRIVTTPGDQGEAPTGEPDTVPGVVVGLDQDDSTGNSVVNVEVTYAAAPKVSALAASGKAAIILDSQVK